MFRLFQTFSIHVNKVNYFNRILGWLFLPKNRLLYRIRARAVIDGWRQLNTYSSTETRYTMMLPAFLRTEPCRYREIQQSPPRLLGHTVRTARPIESQAQYWVYFRLALSHSYALHASTAAVSSADPVAY